MKVSSPAMTGCNLSHPEFPQLILLFLLAVFVLVFWFTFTIAAPIHHWLDVIVVGLLQEWVTNTFAGILDWLASLLVDSVLGGAGIVVIFVPIW